MLDVIEFFPYLLDIVSMSLLCNIVYIYIYRNINIHIIYLLNLYYVDNIIFLQYFILISAGM